MIREWIAIEYQSHDFTMIDESEQELFIQISHEPMDIEPSDHYPTPNPEAAKINPHNDVHLPFFPPLAAPLPVSVPCFMSNEAVPECEKWGQMAPQAEEYARQHSGQHLQRGQTERETERGAEKGSKSRDQSTNQTSDLKIERTTDGEQGRRNLLKPSGSFRCSGNPRKSVRFQEVPADVVYSY